MKKPLWPGTNLPRSTGNAFDWRGGRSVILTLPTFKGTAAKPTPNVKQREFTIYTRAKSEGGK